MNIELQAHKTKIVCTIGPSSNSRAVISRLIKAGMNVARLNLSHGTLPDHIKTLNLIRTMAGRLDKTVSVMIDLPGPKIRVGEIKNGSVDLKKNDIVSLTEARSLSARPSSAKSSSDSTVIPVDSKHFFSMAPGKGFIYLNDGFIQLKVEKKKDKNIICKVVVGGLLTSHKGLNIPGTKPGISGVTDHDLKLIGIFLKHGVDIFCVSFVDRMEDIQKVKRFIKNKGGSADVIAKIERSQAVKNIDGIFDVADGIMVARGDLGVEIPIEQVPVVQKVLIQKAGMRGKVVITATQMLLSMTEHIRPTRAEVTDVANAILDGTDAVMLSEETAMGSYPVEAVKMMVRIASITESKRKEFGCLYNSRALKNNRTQKDNLIEDALAFDVKDTIERMPVKMIITHDNSGNTARSISRFKPDCWIVSTTGSKKIMHLLNLSYGVYPLLMLKDTSERREWLMALLYKNRLLNQGDRILLVEETLNKKGGHTNSLNIITV